MRSHAWIDGRSLALHDAVASKLESNPELLEIARDNLRRWRPIERASALAEWRRLLDVMPLPGLVALLRSTDEEAVRLRQSSPFAGILSADERRAILHRYDSRRP